MHSFGLKPFNTEDAHEAMNILKAFVQDDKEKKKEETDAAQ